MVVSVFSISYGAWKIIGWGGLFVYHSGFVPQVGDTPTVPLVEALYILEAALYPLHKVDMARCLRTLGS